MNECIKIVKTKAKECGVEADIFISEIESSSVKVRNQEIELLKNSNEILINIRVIKDKRCSSISYNDPSKTDESFRIALESLEFLPEDPFIDLPKDQYELEDGQVMSDKNIGLLKEMAFESEKSALSNNLITNSDGATFAQATKRITLSNTRGFHGRYIKQVFSGSLEVIAGRGDGMVNGYDYIVTNDPKCIDPIKIGKIASEKAVKSLNSRKIGTCKLDVIFEADCAKSLLKIFAGAINGKSIAQSSTFLKDKLRKQVFRREIQIINDPVSDGIGKLTFDDEGTLTKKLHLVEDGILQTWLLDIYNANKLNLSSNGTARRSGKGSIYPSCSNLYIKSSNQISEKEIIQCIKKGLYVTEIFGFGVNSVTGDYSQGARGFMIENGQITFPVSEITIAGNLKSMFENMIAADNITFKDYINSPSLFVGEMTVSGK